MENTQGLSYGENVPGAFSSNKGEDFKAVLEAVCSVKDEVFLFLNLQREMGKRRKYRGRRIFLAWRVPDAQFWESPNVEKRIYLVADFAGGECRKDII